MKRTVGAVLFPLATLACEGNDAGTFDYARLVEGIRNAGARVESRGEVTQPFFSVPGRVIAVNGEDVQVFEYTTPALAERESRKVSADGGTINGTSISWVGPPHFYRRERVIVLYVGHNPDVRTVLDAVLGPQFAGR